ncbi:MAG: PIN domain-containing protein [Deltaproteobacteria bacterium]|nr:PIN domain-containing protein [Deltaproteobacteria bacterium]
MTSETFIDTSGFYALLVQGDAAHKKAKSVLANAHKKQGRFITTDYVLDETATLLRARRQSILTTHLFRIIDESQACRIEWILSEREQIKG